MNFSNFRAVKYKHICNENILAKITLDDGNPKINPTNVVI